MLCQTELQGQDGADGGNRTLIIWVEARDIGRYDTPARWCPTEDWVPRIRHGAVSGIRTRDPNLGKVVR